MNSFQIEKNISLFFNSLRGGSALVVLLVHAYKEFMLPVTGDGVVWDILALLAAYAVMTFFIISGFMITSSIIHNVEKNGAFSEQQYIKSRLIRLYPPLLAATAIVILVNGVIHFFEMPGASSFELDGTLALAHHNVTVDWKNLIASIFFLQNMHPSFETPYINDPLWSLSFEFWYYTIALFFASTVINKKIVTGLLPLTAICLYTYLSDTAHQRFAYFSFVWITGGLMALLYYQKLLSHQKYLRWSCALLSILALAVFKISQQEPYSYLITTGKYAGSVVVQCLISVAIAIFISWYLAHLTHTEKEWRFTNFSKTADYSYTLYVIHVPIFVFLYSLSRLYFPEPSIFQSIIFSIISSAIVVITSWQFAQYLENPKAILSLRKYF